jgi:hypothetical protein
VLTIDTLRVADLMKGIAYVCICDCVVRGKVNDITLRRIQSGCCSLSLTLTIEYDSEFKVF